MRLDARRLAALGEATRALLLVALGLAALLNVCLALALIWRPDEIRFGESLVYDHAARVLRGEPLYQPLDRAPYTVATYTPLYYWLVAGLRLIGGPGFLGGRVVSLVCGALAVALVGWLVWWRTRMRWPALVGSVLFAALGLVGPIPWTAVYKEDLAAVALALGSTALLAGAPSRAGAVGAGALAAAALLTKQSLVGPAIVGPLWLLACRPRAAPYFVGTLLVLTLGTLAALELSTGAFVANMLLGARQHGFDGRVLTANLVVLAVFQGVPLVLGLAYLARVKSVRHDLLALSWLGSLIPLLGLGAVGSDFNYWVHCAAATAVLAAIAVWERRAAWSGVAGAFGLGMNALAAVAVIGGVVLLNPRHYQAPGASDTVLDELVDQVRRAPGEVLADPLDVVVLAEREILLDPFGYRQLELSGAWDAGPLVERICTGQVSLLVLGHPLELDDERWPVRVLGALRESMRLQAQLEPRSGSRFVYVPGGQGCPG